MYEKYAIIFGEVIAISAKSFGARLNIGRLDDFDNWKTMAMTRQIYSI